MTFNLIGNNRILQIPISRYRKGKPYYFNCVKEYNGHHVHPDPKLEECKRLNWKHAYTKSSYEEQLIKDNLKLSFMLNQDFVVLEVWDNDINCYENSIKFIHKITQVS